MAVWTAFFVAIAIAHSQTPTAVLIPSGTLTQGSSANSWTVVSSANAPGSQQSSSASGSCYLVFTTSFFAPAGANLVASGSLLVVESSQESVGGTLFGANPTGSATGTASAYYHATTTVTATPSNPNPNPLNPVVQSNFYGYGSQLTFTYKGNGNLTTDQPLLATLALSSSASATTESFGNAIASSSNGVGFVSIYSQTPQNFTVTDLNAGSDGSGGTGGAGGGN